MTNALYRLGRFTARRPVVTILAWLATAAIVLTASATLGRDLHDTFEVPGLDSQDAVDLLSAAGSTQAGLTAQVVVTPQGPADRFGEPVTDAALAAIVASVSVLDDVVEVQDPLISPNAEVALVRVQYPLFETLDVSAVDDIVAVAESASAGGPLRVEVGGDLLAQFDDGDTDGTELIGLIAAIVILLVAFGSLVATGLPIGVALFGLAIGLGTMPLITYVIEIPAWTPDIATMIGLGVGIDYALFLVTRHREHLAQGMSVEESVGRSVATAGQAVIFAGGTVVVAILGLAIAGVPFITAAGVATSVIVLLMVLAAVTLVPAFLGLAGTSINRLSLHRRSHRRSHRGSTVATAAARWERWGAHVARHAKAYAIGVTALLLAMTAPVLALRLGNPDQGTLPEGRTERAAYDLVANGFGPGINGPLLVAVDIAGDPAVADTIAAAVAADPGIASVAPPAVDLDVGVATIVAMPTTAPQDAATVDTIERLRAEVLPGAIGDSPARAHVGGQTAALADIAGRVADRMPAFIGAVIALSFVLLTIVFRAPLVALKAAVLNLLSIGAAYGVLVMVFQWGWGKDLIGLESTIPVIAFIPMFMFAILFGLSMDYEVFLLSRVREEYLATGDNDRSVIHGIASTARVITSAALIMISVFLGFALADDPTIKMFGLGLATAILVDATIVRVVLVPATMKLLGEANWWIPAWLDRLLPTVDIDGAECDMEMPPVHDAAA